MKREKLFFTERREKRKFFVLVKSEISLRVEMFSESYNIIRPWPFCFSRQHHFLPSYTHFRCKSRGHSLAVRSDWRRERKLEMMPRVSCALLRRSCITAHDFISDSQASSMMISIFLFAMLRTNLPIYLLSNDNFHNLTVSASVLRERGSWINVKISLLYFGR